MEFDVLGWFVVAHLIPGVRHLRKFVTLSEIFRSFSQKMACMIFMCFRLRIIVAT